MAITYKLIDKTVLTGTQASITWTSIPQTYTDLKIICSIRTNGSGSWQNIYVRFNGSSTDYYNRYLQGNGSSLGTGTAGGGMIGDLIQNSQQASTFAIAETYIPQYTTSSNYQPFSGEGIVDINTSTSFQQINSNNWAQNAAITSITVIPNNGDSWVQYSTFYLYGITNA